MNSLKKIREKFCISQQQMADWLGISRSLVEYYERGTRTLPTHALLQLSKLEMMIVEFEKESSKGYEASHELLKPLEPLEHIVTVELDKAGRLQQQLSILKSRHELAQQQMLIIKKLFGNCDEQTSEKEKRWLQMLYHGVVCKISKFDETKQLPIKAKILQMRVKQEMMNRKVS